ncbi:hypothetical protein PR003_g25818 [Phytophthora rubi]|uniref:DDE Tnp4 domain-containing protein n=1 Tax=Phytophthora rubi TaxID=129364 RepID=A0A6A4CC42_9STRA|nr:hypothetical protein PR001_g24258 [Phytophthora rubi]KAE9288368.1 hypothetical protein PR003_g25818 [Phytophthora rubi]
MSTQVKEKKDFKWVNEQCMTCVLLHNFAIDYNDTDPFDTDDEEDDDILDENNARETQAGSELRDRVKESC